jgi:hypothetical protein
MGLKFRWLCPFPDHCSWIEPLQLLQAMEHTMNERPQAFFAVPVGSLFCRGTSKQRRERIKRRWPAQGRRTRGIVYAQCQPYVSGHWLSVERDRCVRVCTASTHVWPGTKPCQTHKKRIKALPSLVPTNSSRKHTIIVTRSISLLWSFNKKEH